MKNGLHQKGGEGSNRGLNQKGGEGSNRGPSTFKNQGRENNGTTPLIIYFSILQADRGHPGDQWENLAGTQVWSNQHV